MDRLGCCRRGDRDRARECARSDDRFGSRQGEMAATAGEVEVGERELIAVGSRESYACGEDGAARGSTSRAKWAKREDTGGDAGEHRNTAGLRTAVDAVGRIPGPPMRNDAGFCDELEDAEEAPLPPPSVRMDELRPGSANGFAGFWGA